MSTRGQAVAQQNAKKEEYLDFVTQTRSQMKTTVESDEACPVVIEMARAKGVIRDEKHRKVA
ncbi:hypothetical protein E1162_03005 [Rhodobacteraceae bacterium RKSG542]|uniref:hypothetical protein n=1 Tax=Pseudovibrio flavus TaxID=2529854 RepID=UPI0012BB7632|nr:hypothetical protein [Pseudovibrio flavus]MTI16204.1 hypothetical protein [Pseudovibrio flavus]